MIDQRGRTEAPRLALRLPVPTGAARALVLAAVFVCAACGLVYELELVALASYLVGDSVTQASVILSVMVFAMGCGSLLAKRLRGRAAASFAAVETGLALVGGLSVMALYAFFAWFGQATPAMVGCAFAIGVLIGAEVPLLMTLVQRIRRQDAGGAVADLFAADYVGALVGGLAFPFLLLPRFGQLTGALATGVVNALAGGATVLWLFRGDLSRRTRGWLTVANVAVLAVLVGAAVAAGPFERAARQAVYGGDVRVAEQSAVQEIVLTGGGRSGQPVRLYLDGRLRLSGADSVRYAQALVHPAMGGGPRGRVLILGGGDGLALRQVLRYADVRAATVVQPDADLLRLARTDTALTALNGHAFDDPRVRTVAADPFDWLRGAPPGAFDVVVADLPDPGMSSSAKLYSQEFYGLAARALAPGGRIAVHAGTATGPARTFWTIDATVRAVGLRTSPYWVPGGTNGGAASASASASAAPGAGAGAAAGRGAGPGAGRSQEPVAGRGAGSGAGRGRESGAGAASVVGPSPEAGTASDGASGGTATRQTAGECAFLLAARGRAPALALPRAVRTDLTPGALRKAARAPLSTRPVRALPPSTLLRPRIPAS